MKLLPLLFVCLVSRSEGTCPAGNGPTDPRAVKEGADVVLRCSLSPEKDISTALFDWKKVALKDQHHKEVFLYDAGRYYNDDGKHYNNGLTGQSEQFRGRVSHFPEELKHGNASIIIRNTKVEDSGNYTCHFPRLQPPITIELVVGAAPKPFVKILNARKNGTLIQCEVVRSFPKPHVEWQDSSGKKISAKEPQVSESGGTILEATVTKSDYYYCVATQETINHQTCADTYVPVSGAAPDVYVAGFPTVAVVVSVLVLFF